MGKCIQNLHLVNSYVEFDSVDGGTNGGLATMDIGFAALGNAKLRLTVNGADYRTLTRWQPAAGARSPAIRI